MSEKIVRPEDDSDPKGFMYVPRKRDADEAAVTIGRRFALGGPVLTIFGVIAGILICAWVKLESHGGEISALKEGQAATDRKFDKLDAKMDRMLEIVLEKKKAP